MARVVSESRLHERRRRARNIRIGIFCALVFLFLIGLVALSRAPFMRITSVVVSGASDDLVPSVQGDVESKISGAYLGLFARNNILLYPKSGLVGALLEEFPELKSVSMHVVGLHTLDVVAVERQPVALWCGVSAPSALSAGLFPLTYPNCFYLDENSFVYASEPIPLNPADVTDMPPYYGALSSGQGGVGGQFLSSQEFHTLYALVSAFQKSIQSSGGAYGVAGVQVNADANIQVFFGDGFELRFLLSDNAGDVLQRFALAQSSDVFKGHTLADFKYIDLRFGDRIYYKLKTK